MGGALYTHYALNDKMERMTPVVVFSLLLICRIIISYQVDRREKFENKEDEKMKQLMKEDETEEDDKTGDESFKKNE